MITIIIMMIFLYYFHSPSYICYSHNCDIEMIKHVRYFAHGNGSLYINMRNLDSPIPGYDRTILTWSWCKQCKQVKCIRRSFHKSAFHKNISLNIFTFSAISQCNFPIRKRNDVWFPCIFTFRYKVVLGLITSHFTQSFSIAYAFSLFLY